MTSSLAAIAADDPVARLRRIETRLAKFMTALGVNPNKDETPTTPPEEFIWMAERDGKPEVIVADLEVTLLELRQFGAANPRLSGPVPVRLRDRMLGYFHF